MFKSKVFLKFITSYIAVLLIPLAIVSGIIYSTFVNKLTDEVTGSTRRMLLQVSDVMDMRLRDLSSLTYRISSNNELTPIFSDKADNFEISAVSNDIKILNDYKQTNGIIENIFIFNRSKDIIIGDMGKYDNMTYTSNGPQWNYTTSPYFLDYVKTVSGMTVLPASPALVNGITVNIISYMQPLPISSGSNFTGTLLVTIRESAIQQLIQKILGDYSGHIYVADSKNNIIVTANLGTDSKNDSSNSSVLASGFINNNGEDRRMFSQEQDGYILSYVKSELTGWKYVAVMNSKQVLHQVESVKSIFITIIGFALLIGFGFAMYFSRGNYSNIKKITDNILKNRDNSASIRHYKNEWYLIDSAVSDYIDRTKSLQQKLADQLPLIRNDFLMRLLNGDLTDSSTIQSLMEFTKLKLDYPCFAVILINIDDYPRFSNENSEPAQGVMRITIANTAEELCSGVGSGYAVEPSRDKIAVVAAVNSTGDNILSVIENEIARSICRFTKENLGFTVTVAISNIHESITSLNKACQECETALSYKILKGTDSVICFGEVANRMNNIYFYTFEQEKRILQYLRQGEYEPIRTILDDIISRIKTSSTSLEVVRCIYFEIINTAVKSLHELEIESTEYNGFLTNILDKKSLDEVYNEVCGFYSILCEQVSNAKHIKNESRKNMVIKYINEHYSDSNLSVDAIADAFSVSASYMGKLIRDQIGCSFVDYLNGIRIEKAKELLSLTDMNIGEVAGQTGYNSIYNFTRVFKRYENVTPGQFRLSKTAGTKNIPPKG